VGRRGGGAEGRRGLRTNGGRWIGVDRGGGEGGRQAGRRVHGAAVFRPKQIQVPLWLVLEFRATNNYLAPWLGRAISRNTFKSWRFPLITDLAVVRSTFRARKPCFSHIEYHSPAVDTFKSNNTEGCNNAGYGSIMKSVSTRIGPRGLLLIPIARNATVDTKSRNKAG
jgi:hypothetical protein